MNDPFFYYMLLFVVTLFALIQIALIQIHLRKNSSWIQIPFHAFRDLLEKKQSPVVLWTTSGSFLYKRICYVHPHDGIVFYTFKGIGEFPENVKLIKINENENADNLELQQMARSHS
jgi:hypothetical protein